MSTIRRIARLLRDGALARPGLVESMKEDPAVADDGLIAFAIIGVVVVGATTREWLAALIALVAAPLAALFVAFVLRLVNRIVGNQVTLAETTATVTLTSLPLLLVIIPVVGGPMGITWWLLSGILTLHRVTLARLDNAAVVTLLSHALSIGAVFALGYALQLLL